MTAQTSTGSRSANTNGFDSIVYIVDDDPAARESVAALVQSHGMRTREFPSAESFLEQIGDTLTGCLVLDVRMTGMSGLDLQERLAGSGVDLPIIVITAFADVPMAVRAMKAGAVSFLTKPCDPEKLWENIDEALMLGQAGRSQRHQRLVMTERLATLTEDELLVLERVMQGKPNKRIARELDIGLRTVELRRSHLMKKMQIDSLAELVKAAMLAGFSIDSPPEDGPANP